MLIKFDTAAWGPNSQIVGTGPIAVNCNHIMYVRPETPEYSTVTLVTGYEQIVRSPYDELVRLVRLMSSMREETSQ
jgi:hypothetical protein